MAKATNKQSGTFAGGITIETDGNNVVITMPIDKAFPLSKTKKTHRVASSEGNKPTGVKVKGPDGDDHEVVAGLNLYYKASQPPAE